MSDDFSFRKKPTGLFKWLLQAPKWVFRARLGFIFASGLGAKADWYRNIQGNPAQAIWIGRHRYSVAQRFLPTEEAVEVMKGYEREHPKTAAKLESMMGVSHDETQASWMAMMEKLPMTGFTPHRR